MNIQKLPVTKHLYIKILLCVEWLYPAKQKLEMKEVWVLSWSSDESW